MDDNEEEDTHLCLRCSATISGLKNYIAHRKQHCSKTQRSDSTISSLTSPAPGQHYEPSTLRADDFFSSLELQSIQAVIPSDGHGISSANKPVQGDDDLEDAEDSDNDFYPPTFHTGGKWKPGWLPDGRSEWKGALSPREPPTQECKEPTSCAKDFVCVPCKRFYHNKLTFLRHQQTIYHRKRSGELAAYKPKISQRLLSKTTGYKITTVLDAYNAKTGMPQNSGEPMEHFPHGCIVCNQIFVGKGSRNNFRKRDHVEKEGRFQSLPRCLTCGYECPGDDGLSLHLCTAKQHYHKHLSVCSASNTSQQDKLSKKHCNVQCSKIWHVQQQQQQQSTAHKSAFTADIEQGLHQCDVSLSSGRNAECLSHGRHSQGVPELSGNSSACNSGLSVEDRTVDKQAERVSCPHCKKIMNKMYLKVHMHKHTGEKPFACQLCDKHFAHRSTLSTHMKHHLGLRKFPCSQCKFRAVRRSMLRRHELAVHRPKDSEKTHMCGVCGFKFHDRESLRRHIARHTAKHACGVADCGRSFPDMSSLKNHSLVHCNTRQFLCDVCGYASASICQLRKHQRRHMEERPFKCLHCDYTALYSSHVQRHSRIHSGLKPYSCPYCSYQCSSQENIRKHILKTKKHVGKKVYPCQHCDFGCNEFSKYKDHIHSQHPQYHSRKDLLHPKAPDRPEDEYLYSLDSEMATSDDGALDMKEMIVHDSPSLPEPALFLTIPELNGPGLDASSPTANHISPISEGIIVPESELSCTKGVDLTDATAGILLSSGLDSDLSDQLNTQLNDQVSFGGLDSGDIVYACMATPVQCTSSEA